MLSAIVLVAIIRYHRQKLPLAPSSAFGRGQLLFLIILWVAIAAVFMQAFPGMNKASAKLRLGIYYLRKSVFFDFFR